MTDPSLTYEAQADFYRTRSPLPIDDALALWQSGAMKFFGVVPRKVPANNGEACVDHHDVVWADIDREVGIDPWQVLDEVNTILRPLKLEPSAAVFSGSKGLHLYWRMSEAVPITAIEDYNKALKQLLKGDKCWERARLLRIPGTMNEKDDGQRVELMHLDPQPIPLTWFNALETAQPRLVPEARAGRSHRHSGTPEWLEAASAFEGWEEPHLKPSALTDQMWAYMFARPPKGWSSYRYETRSEIEAAIVSRLVRRGASDWFVRVLADEYLARHREEAKRNLSDPYRYINQTIDTARERLFIEEGLVSSPLGGWPRVAEPKKRRLTNTEHHRLVELAEGKTKSELHQVLSSEIGRSRSSAYRDISRVEASGRIVLDPESGRYRPP